MKKIVLLMLLAIVSGCATAVETSISSFHNLENHFPGSTYTILPIEQQEGSLEFQTYANLVKNEMNRYGFAESQFNDAKYVVFLKYGIDNGREVTSTIPIYGQTGVSSSYTTGNVNMYGNTATYSGTTYNTPTYGITGTQQVSSTEYTRYLFLDIVDKEKSTEKNLAKVYEGHAISRGSSEHLSAVMPAIIKSVFKDFPGKSGETRIVRQTLER